MAFLFLLFFVIETRFPNLKTTVAHKCHGKLKKLTAKYKRPQQIKEAHGKIQKAFVFCRELQRLRRKLTSFIIL